LAKPVILGFAEQKNASSGGRNRLGLAFFQARLKKSDYFVGTSRAV
jgi:hypothetical protein